AGPPSAAYRARKFVARNRPQVVAAGTVALTLVIGLVGTSVGLARAALARAEAERERQNALAAAETEKVARQAEAEQRKAAEAQTAAANAAKAFLQSVLVQGVPRRATPGRAADPSRTLRAALDWASKDIEGRFAGQPEIAADLRGTIGEAYHGLGAYPAAEGHLRAALNLSETAHGAAHPRTLSSLQYLAELYLDQGDWRTAEVLFKRALEGLEKALGPGHPGTLGCAHGLGTVYLATGDLGSAERLLDRVLAGAEKAPGPDHPDTLTAVFHLAIVYQEKGDTGSAERLLDRVLAGREKALGPDHPDTLASVNHLAKIYLDSGEYSRAEPLLLRALDGQRRVLGPDHPLTLSSVNNLAGLYWSTGRLDRSIPLFEDTLKRQRAVLGDEHPETLRMSANLGVNYKDAGRVAEGVPLLELAYAARAKHPAQLGWVGPELVAAYVKAGRPADAARVVGEGLAEARAKVKPGSPELGNVLAMSGKRLLPLDPAAAEPVLRECLELREKLNPKAWNTANARSLLGAALLLQGKPAEAEPLLVAGYAGLLADRANIPPMPAAQANLPDAADRLVELYAALGKPDEAKRWRAERAKYPFVAPPPRPAK
ncbi:MAG: tetratricopeptide repeat protein, partial [Gemmataceae bacterium]|nr:tetratricopeptide repeat protein [Gemmataceae bacterium]